MAEFRVTEVLPHLPEEVFDFATNFDNVSKWNPQILEIELLDPPPIQAGTRFRERRKIGKREATAVIEVVAHDRPRIHAARSAAMGVDATYHYYFRPSPRGTEVELHADVRTKWWMRPFQGMLLKMMKREDGPSLERLAVAMAEGQSR